jgi:ATP synthase protein I
MSDYKNRDGDAKLPEAVGEKAERRIKARRTGDRSVWFGMGMFGLVGWTVAIYTVLGILLGTWLDRRWPQGFSWTLTLLFAGLIAGVINAWHWINKESRAGEDNEDGPGDSKTK